MSISCSPEYFAILSLDTLREFDKAKSHMSIGVNGEKELDEGVSSKLNKNCFLGLRDGWLRWAKHGPDTLCSFLGVFSKGNKIISTF